MSTKRSAWRDPSASLGMTKGDVRDDKGCVLGMTKGVGRARA